MRLKLECLQGPRAGDHFILREEATLGRKAELPLRDPKSSAAHAKIYMNSEGLPEIKDLQSANGTKVNGKKITEQVLALNDVITIGETLLKVMEIGEPGVEPPSNPVGQEEEWGSAVDRLLQRVLVSLKTAAPGVHSPKAFSPPLQISFEQGLQAGQEFTLGFGPRTGGANSSDLFIAEKEGPALAFEIIPKDNGRAFFRTDHSSVVRLNGRSIDESELNDGDKIQVGQTVLKVRIQGATK